MAISSLGPAEAGRSVSTTVPSTTTYWYGGSSCCTVSVMVPARSIKRAFRLPAPVLIRILPPGV
ncbi:Uncharacterised protein [Mycobacteroides abscessus subsp. abscessus]|nr:Uncharacterised protein [Mycobacteroides abscessus subsp. abscessus]